MPHTASTSGRSTDSHTATGAPLLAGDPHLAFGFPGIWYLARIDTPNHVLAGATAPGVPFLVIGHNEKIAWTFTTTGADVQDIFIETPAGAGQYQTPDGPKPFTVREERIGVRGQPRRAADGARDPAWAGDQRSRHPDGPIMAVAMGNLQPDDTAAAGLLALNRARSVAGGRGGSAADQFAGAEPAGGGRQDHRPVRHRPGADPQGRRRRRPGAGRRLA